MPESSIISEQISLAPYTSYKIGGVADYFAEPHSTDEVAELYRWASEHGQSVFILGGGTNLLFSSSGFRGLVMRPQFLNFQLNETTATVGATVSLADVLTRTLDNGFTGLEFIAGIPGTAGGALYGNAGTYGRSISDVLIDVDVYDTDKHEVIKFKRTDLAFAYRHSQFKEMQQMLITQMTIKLEKGDLTQSQQTIAEWLERRKNNHPIEPSAGSTFKNILMDEVDVAKLESMGLDLTPFKQYAKIPAGYLIDRLDLKGKTIGGAQISPKHANYIINTGAATSEDVIMMISLIKQAVRDTFGIQLQEEIQLVPEKLD